MAGLSTQLNLVGKLLLLAGCGFFLRKKNIIPENGKALLTDLVLLIVLPCSIIHSFLSYPSVTINDNMRIMFLLSVLIQIASVLLSKVLFLHCDKDNRTSLAYGIVVPNSGILGTPVAAELFGETGVMLSSVYLVPMRLCMWTFGMAVFTKEINKKSALRAITHPCVLAVVFGFIMMLLHIRLPGVITETVAAIGGCNTFLSMILIGAVMGDMDLRLLFHKEAIYFVLLRLVAIPALVFIACNLVFSSGDYVLIRNVCVILTAMPAGATTPLMALKYGQNESFASAIVALSTVLSLLAIPVWCLFLS